MPLLGDLRCEALGGLPELILIDLEAWEVRMYFSMALLENLGSEAREACQA